MTKQSFLEFASGLYKTSPLLRNVEAAKKKRRQEDPVVRNFLEILDFYKANGREPSIDGGVNERRLANQLHAYRTRLRERVASYDDVGLLDMNAGEVKKKPRSGVLRNFAEILKSDKHGLLSGVDASIFEIKHVRDRNDAFRNMPDEIASRKTCRDFGMFEKTFRDIQQSIAMKRAKLMRFSSEVQIDVGHFYVLNGIVCYVAEVLDERKEEIVRNVVERDNPRFRVIFDNGVETNILKRSLARALYKDPHGRAIIRSGEDTPILVPETGTKEPRETGCVYILSSGTNAPALADMKRCGMLHKIGFSTQDVMERIRGAEKDPTYLEAPVKLEANIRCFDLDPRRMEALIHAFLVNQRISMTMYTSSGKPYVPREWYNVDLETALEVARHVADGTIMEYRMDNTTNRIRRIGKESDAGPWARSKLAGGAG